MVHSCAFDVPRPAFGSCAKHETQLRRIQQLTKEAAQTGQAVRNSEHASRLATPRQLSAQK